ncbi:protein rolling stone isoform X2 [Procambarus clarkii]|uniref:protein rolling stone isoform X2 n=1 Tax=Procambarus clarkii TaxID=6728 RepID=UPI0037448373
MGCWSRCWATLRREFKLSNFKLDHQDPYLFLASEWQGHPVSGVKAWYVAYRWAWAVYHVSWWAANFANEGGIDAGVQRKAYHFIYLTNWAYLSITVLWVLQNIVFLPALLVTAAYWSAIYNPVNPVTALNAEVHIINTVYVLIDLWTVASPLRILHFYIPFSFMLVYLVFTLIYWAAGGTTPDGGTAIYPIMDWENLSITLPFVVCCSVFSPLMQGVVWGLYRVRVMVRHGCCRSSVVANLPHQGTMDVILDRDASMESVAPHLPEPVTSQTV